MAKALLGSIGGDSLATARLARENSVLRQRVVDLEHIVLRLQKENDALAEVASESVDHAVARDRSLARS